MMRVTVENLQKKIPINPARIQRIAKKILKKERIGSANLSIAFVSDQKIKALNKKYLKREYTTDVLSFDLGEGFEKRRGGPAGRPLCGQIIISTDTALKNSTLYQTPPQKEIILYVIHGILHLLGYDDHGVAQTKRMRLREAFHLKALKV